MGKNKAEVFAEKRKFEFFQRNYLKNIKI